MLCDLTAEISHCRTATVEISPFISCAAAWLGYRTCNQQVAGSNSSLPAVECNPAQVVNTHVPVTKQYNLVPANGR